jgi:hypothetical protein
MQTRKYPRILEQAFGPYARGPITEKEEPMHTPDKIVLVSSCIAGVCLIGFMVFNWIS